MNVYYNDGAKERKVFDYFNISKTTENTVPPIDGIVDKKWEISPWILSKETLYTLCTPNKNDPEPKNSNPDDLI